MYRTTIIMIVVFAALFSLPRSVFAQDTISPDAGVPESADAGEPEPEEVEEPVLEEPFVPDVEIEDDAYDDDDYQDDALQEALDNLPDGKPFAKGDIELGLGLGGGGGSGYFRFAVMGTFMYYVVNHFAPGIRLVYSKTFHDDYDYPHALLALPLAKVVLIRSRRFAPFLLAGAGREFQWGGAANSEKGVEAVGAWLVAMGGGAHIGIGSRFFIKIQIEAHHYWWDDTRVYGFPDDMFTETTENGEKYFQFDPACDPSTQSCLAKFEEDDMDDKEREWFFPLITVGFSILF
jgi:hypothetical protein